MVKLKCWKKVYSSKRSIGWKNIKTEDRIGIQKINPPYAPNDYYAERKQWEKDDWQDVMAANKKAKVLLHREMMGFHNAVRFAKSYMKQHDKC